MTTLIPGMPHEEEQDDSFISDTLTGDLTPSTAIALSTTSPTLNPLCPRDLPKSQSVTAQLQELNLYNAKHLTINTLPRIRFAQKRYFLHSWLPRRHKLRPFVIDHGFVLIEVNGNTLGNTFWLCSYCDKRGKTQGCLFAQQATSAAIAHLRTQHSITPYRGRDPSSSPALCALAALQSNAKPSIEMDMDTSAFGSASEFKAALIHWIVESNISFKAIEHDTFQRLIRTPKHIIDTALPTHQPTIKLSIMDEFKVHQKRIKSQLQDAQSLIHLTFNAWTSPDQQALLGVTSHFTDLTGVPTTKLLALKHISGFHSGENIAPLVLKVIKDYNLKSLGFFILDNTSVNDTCLNYLFNDHLPDFPIEPLFIDTSIIRLRCWGHAINLAAKAFLEPTEQARQGLLNNEATIRLTPEEQANLTSWLKSGPVAKLSDVVTFIRWSPQRREAFATQVQHQTNTLDDSDDLFEAQHNIQLSNNNATRWNSTFYMIERALHLRDSIQSWIEVNSLEKEDQRLPTQKRLTEEDWEVLVEVQNLLLPFQQETMRFQSHRPGYIGWVLPSLHRLLTWFKKQRDQRDPDTIAVEELRRSLRAASSEKSHSYSQASPSPIRSRSRADVRAYLRLCCQLALNQLVHYKELIDQTPVYWAAAILHPSIGARWVTHVEPFKYGLIIDRFRNFFFDGWVKEQIQQPQATDTPTQREGCLFDLPNEFYENYTKNDDPAVHELMTWLGRPPERLDDPIAFWQQQQHAFPLLSRMAIDILIIPSMSAECECIYSQAKLIIGSQQHSLADETLEAIECLKHWLPNT